MPKRITIKDVAKEAGVSKSTVSYVLQNSGLVKKETSDKVKAAISKLGYVYNRAAASLRNDEGGLVGLVVNDLRNPFHTELAIAAQMSLAEMGYVTVIANTDESDETQSQVINSMMEHGVSALVISPAENSNPEIFDMLQQRDLPAVLVSREVVGQKKPLPLFSFDYENGGLIATDHLVRHGCKNIAFIGGFENSSVTKSREAGYLEIMAKNDLKEHIFYGRPTRKFGQATAEEIVQNYPEVDGIYCFNDLVGLGCNQQLLKMGICIGECIKVIGFDDIENSSHSEPPLSSVQCDIADLGDVMSKFMVDWIKNRDMPKMPKPWPVKLVARESSLGKK